MISQVASTVAPPQTNTNPTPSLVDVQAQKPAAPVELPQQAVQAVEKASIKTIKDAAGQINKLIQQFDRNLQFTVDEETGTNVIKVIDNQSKEVIRQMPTEEMLAIAKALDKLQGLLIRDKV